MSLYQVQKFLYELNRDPALQTSYRADPASILSSYDLSQDELEAIKKPDIGFLYHLGVNGQILMHFAAWHRIEWSDYLELMREGLNIHGPVREGVYALTGYAGPEAN